MATTRNVSASAAFVAYARANGVTREIRDLKGRTRLAVDQVKADAVFADSGGFFPIGQLHTKIGAPRRARAALVNGGLLTPVLSREGFDHERRPLRGRDVDELLDRFRAAAEVIEVIPAGAVRLSNLHHHVRGSLAEVHDLILAKRIWCGRLSGEKPYAALVVRIEEVRTALSEDASELFSLAQFSKQVGVRQQTIFVLTRSGFLPAGVVRNPKTGLLRKSYESETVARFASTYISLRRLAGPLKRRPAELRFEIARKGIDPTFDPEAIGTILYRREDLRRIGFDLAT